jgi:hypothetical protein
MKAENELWPQDEVLFKTIEQAFTSIQEKQFFRTLKEKMKYENAPWPEVLISEHDNDDHLYLLRQTYDEFMLGKGVTRTEWQAYEMHTMSLSEILSINLKEGHLLDRNVTLLQWLRERDYACVRYDHSNDGNIS